MSVQSDQIAAAEERVLDAAEITPDVLDGLDQLVAGRQRAVSAEAKLMQDLAAIELLRDALDEQDRRVKDRRKDADKAQSELLALAGDLGRTSFEAFELGDLENIPLYDARRAARDEVETIEGEITELSEARGFGAVVKAKARQAALLARSAATRARFRSLEREIGRALIEDRREESVRCEKTEVVLSKIAAARTGVRQLDRLLNAANAERIATGQTAEDEYSLETVRAPKDLKPAIQRIEMGIAAAKKDQSATSRELLQRLDVAVSLGELDKDSELWMALKILREMKSKAAS